MKKLLITIPSFNEYSYLKKNIDILVNQVSRFQNDVDLYLIDNDSTDDTGLKIPDLFDQHDNCFYIKNKKNIGLYKNQLKCLEINGYNYQMVLGSDDILVPNAVESILAYIDKGDFSIIYLNYFSFLSNYLEPYQFFAPEENVIFDRPYDLLNHPSVGHFSGFIFKSNYVKKYLQILLEKYDEIFFEKHRGIIAFLAPYICSKEKNKTLFIGKRYLGTTSRKQVSYDSLQHLCVDYLEGHYLLFQDGISNQNDFNYRKKLIKKMLFKSTLRNLPFLDIEKNYNIYKELKFFFKKEIYFLLIISPIFYLMRVKLIKNFSAFLIKKYLDQKI